MIKWNRLYEYVSLLLGLQPLFVSIWKIRWKVFFSEMLQKISLQRQIARSVRCRQTTSTEKTVAVSKYQRKGFPKENHKVYRWSRRQRWQARHYDPVQNAVVVWATSEASSNDECGLLTLLCLNSKSRCRDTQHTEKPFKKPFNLILYSLLPTHGSGVSNWGIRTHHFKVRASEGWGKEKVGSRPPYPFRVVWLRPAMSNRNVLLGQT